MPARNRFTDGFAGIVAGDDFDPLLGAGKPFLANFYQLHSFFIPNDQIFELHLAGFHLLDNRFQPIHRAFEIQFGASFFLLSRHRGDSIKHTALHKKARVRGGREFRFAFIDVPPMFGTSNAQIAADFFKSENTDR